MANTRESLTLKYLGLLVVATISTCAGCEVEMPTAFCQLGVRTRLSSECHLHSIHLVHFGGPQVTTSGWVVRGPDNLVLARLEALQGSCPRNLDILIRRGRQVVEAIDVDDVWVTSQGPLQRVGKVGCMEPGGQARGREKSTQGLHFEN